MTASTAPITLPAKHRTAAPLWRPHVALAELTYWAALAVWTVRTFPAQHGRLQTAGVLAVLALIVSAIVAVPVLA